MVRESGGGPKVRAAFLAKLFQQAIEVVGAAVLRGGGEGLPQRRGNAELVMRKIDANEFAIAIAIALLGARLGHGVVKAHGRVTIGRRMSFAFSTIEDRCVTKATVS